jgi:hypothetical protein
MTLCSLYFNFVVLYRQYVAMMALVRQIGWADGTGWEMARSLKAQKVPRGRPAGRTRAASRHIKCLGADRPSGGAKPQGTESASGRIGPADARSLKAQKVPRGGSAQRWRAASRHIKCLGADRPSRRAQPQGTESASGQTGPADARSLRAHKVPRSAKKPAVVHIETNREVRICGR